MTDPRMAPSIFTRGAVDLGALAQRSAAQQRTAQPAAPAGPGAASSEFVIDVTDATFQDEVLQRSLTTPVVIDFWAEWCQPCKQLTPVLEEAVAARDVVLATVDVDANKNLAREYGIAGIPAVKAFKNGREVAGFVGVKTRTMVDAFLDELTRPPVADELDDAEITAALGAGDYDVAFRILLGRAADPEKREDARRVMVALFNELGQDHPLSTQYRKQLATLMF
jgi:putative thioredoxin